MSKMIIEAWNGTPVTNEQDSEISNQTVRADRVVSEMKAIWTQMIDDAGVSQATAMSDRVCSVKWGGY